MSMVFETPPPRVAVVHDYLTQRGGAERVVLSIMKAFPDAPLYTSLFDPEGTFPEFAELDVRSLFINRVGLLRRHHRWALPLLAPSFSRLRIDSSVVLCSSSGWAHGARTTGRKIVYCHSPPKWLHRPDDYFAGGSATRLAAAALSRWLRDWDRHAAFDADRYLANSAAIRAQVKAAYSIEAEVVPAPAVVDPRAPREPVEGLWPGFFLLVSRLLPYKNVQAVVQAFGAMPERRLVVAGTGPEAGRLEAAAPGNVRFVGVVGDPTLRWLYANSIGLVAASYEDYGLTPLEAATFGKPAAVLRWGGFLDTVVEGVTGVFFDEPEPAAIRTAALQLLHRRWNHGAITAHAEGFSELAFIKWLQAIVLEELEHAPSLDNGATARSAEALAPHRPSVLTR